MLQDRNVETRQTRNWKKAERLRLARSKLVEPAVSLLNYFDPLESDDERDEVPEPTSETPVDKRDVWALGEVRLSSIPGAGLGLFLTVDVHSRQEIGRYTGEILHREQFRKRYPPSSPPQYVSELNDDTWIDASGPKGNHLRRINGVSSPSVKPNCGFVADRNGLNEVTFHVLDKALKAGTELICNYGRFFVFVPDHSVHSSSPTPAVDDMT